MAKKVAPKELIQQDFSYLKSSERLYTNPRIEDLLFMQSIEGRSHNGAGNFHKRFFVNTTMEDIVSALGKSPKLIKTKRQELIDEVREYVDSALVDDGRDRLVTKSGRPLLGIPQFKERTVNCHDILKGLYLGGLRDNVEIRKKTQEIYKISIGYGKCYLVNIKVAEGHGIDGELLAHQEHADRINQYKSWGLIVDEEKAKRSVLKNARYLYIRHHVGPGQSDDAAIVASGLLYNVDVALGVFLADAVDTLEKYVSDYHDQDTEIANLIKDKYRFLDVGEKDVYELAYLAAIPEGRTDEIPDSSLRYLLAIDQETGQSTIEAHLNFIEGKPYIPIAISYKRIYIAELYDFVKDKLKSINKEVVAKVPETILKELESSVARAMQRKFITVSPDTSLKTALAKAEARKSDVVIVKDEFGNILGVINPSDFLLFLKERTE